MFAELLVFVLAMLTLLGLVGGAFSRSTRARNTRTDDEAQPVSEPP